MDVTTALLDSWDRQARIVDAVAGRVNESNMHVKPSEDGMPLYAQLAHIHGVRHYFLGQLDKAKAAELGDVYPNGWENPIDDLSMIKKYLNDSAVAVREAVAAAIESGNGQAGWYDNPVLYLQHMVWHEGWHVGLIILALRLNGEEAPQEWEEEKIWGEWRTETW